MVQIYTQKFVSTEQVRNVNKTFFPWLHQQQCMSLQHTKHTEAFNVLKRVHVCGGYMIQGAEEL